ncbi:MAG: YvcK family protein [Candidatus Gracilibacteria bacterium]|nr:YvcK family protein [Candidatus Gracilibacteria bacterium]
MNSICNITTIGGGTGSTNVLLGLKHLQQANLAAIVTSSDSGGSTGELRDEFGILPPGDARRAIAALAKDTERVRKMFEHRFDKSRMKGHTIGNLLLTGLAEMTGSFEEAVDVLSEMFDVRGKVIPVTLDDTQLCVELIDGQKIIGETNIDVPKHDGNLRIKKAYLTGGGVLNPRAKEAILHSDFVVIGPGDLYTSIVPNLLTVGMQEALQQTKAKIIYVCNIMTKHGETNGFEVQDFVDVVEQYIGKDILDFVLVHTGGIPDNLAEKYFQTENKFPVILSDLHRKNPQGYTIIERDLASEHDYVRHDPKKLGRVMQDFLEGWIK